MDMTHKTSTQLILLVKVPPMDAPEILNLALNSMPPALSVPGMGVVVALLSIKSTASVDVVRAEKKI